MKFRVRESVYRLCRFNFSALQFTQFSVSIGMHTTNRNNHRVVGSIFSPFTFSLGFLLGTLWNIMFSMRQGLFLARLLCFIVAVLCKFTWTVLYFHHLWIVDVQRYENYKIHVVHKYRRKSEVSMATFYHIF